MTTDHTRIHTFVLMPYGSSGEYSGGVDESNLVYEQIIKPGVDEAAEGQEWQPVIEREVDRSRAGSVTSALVESLVTADIVIVDLTGRNPNVFFELGIRFAL